MLARGFCFTALSIGLSICSERNGDWGKGMDWWQNGFVWLALLAVGGDSFLKISGFGLSSWRLRGGRVVLLGLRADLVDLGKMMENGGRLVAVSGLYGVRWGLRLFPVRVVAGEEEDGSNNGVSVVSPSGREAVYGCSAMG
ncbi:hypothetical protein KY290_010866 [Solanum tuberosum]|uniref:Uncharacterized protein n=1 Tax=Solanum tuberosum TaxID=4113 RepID=A0ABQ7W127_SOLTU|nr:hypothetical protein KY290_010866 [Solanum tuberosum]